MTMLIKTLPAGQLPQAWQHELGLGPDAPVRVAIEAMPWIRAPQEMARLLGTLDNLEPVDVGGDVTSFIRAERARLDARTGNGG
ncbi:MAG: hypothetical protein AB1749_12250 [Pseudomonadota bacterium]